MAAWISTPASAPTTVPLTRMNCRSRPATSSIRRAASCAVPAVDGVGDGPGDLVAVRRHDVLDGVTDPGVQLGAQGRVGHEPLTPALDRRHSALAQLSVGLVDEVDDGPTGCPYKGAEGLPGRVVAEKTLGQVAQPLGGVGVLAQVLRECREPTVDREPQGVLGVHDDLLGDPQELAVDALRERTVDEGRRPRGGLVLDRAR